MGILINKNTKVVVQGITGREGSVRTKYMKSYGTHVVGGTSPGKKGSDVHGVPVYNTVKEIARRLPENNYKFSGLILEIVNSLPFQMRRGDSAK